ncbi:bifunctional 3-(3-hydroxy-phenyl)propionate/3-hydroxycinnamic acid hydroxylase MhpA [Neomicrococcus lactis]
MVGAGPVGLMLANILGMYGRKVVVLEAMDQLIDYPRGVGLDDESFRTIQTVGLVDTVRPHTSPQHIMRLVNGAGKVILTNNPKTDEFGWDRKHSYIQPEVDKALYEGLARFDNVEVHFGHRVENVEEDANGVTAIALVSQDDDTLVERRFRAQYLVGCEGGKSPTRKRMGVSFDGESPSTRWLVVDVNNDPLGTPNVFLGADPKRPYVSIGLPHAVRRWEFMLLDHETEEQVTDPEIVNQMLKDHVPDPASLDYIRRRVFTHHGRIAGSFRKGRQIIAGDAAHLMPVWMVQGWNSGMRFKPMPRYTEGVLADPSTRTPGRATSRIVSKMIPVLTANNTVSPVGVQFPQYRFNTASQKNALLDDVIGNWWTVIVWGNSPKDVLPEAELEKLRGLGAKLVSIVPETQREWAEKYMDEDVIVLGDHTGRMKKWFDDRPTPMIFLRPDRFVAGACLNQHGPATLEAILSALKFKQGTGAPSDFVPAGVRGASY